MLVIDANLPGVKLSCVASALLVSILSIWAELRPSEVTLMMRRGLGLDSRKYARYNRDDSCTLFDSEEATLSMLQSEVMSDSYAQTRFESTNMVSNQAPRFV